MSGAARLVLGHRHEDRVIQRIREAGYPAFPYGRRLLDPHASELLNQGKNRDGKPVNIRWEPDILIIHENVVRFVDAKNCGGGKRYAIETASLTNALAHWHHDKCDTFFVFEDWGVLTPIDVQRHGFDGIYLGKGSGTPFKLVERMYGKPFDEVFPPLKKAA